MKHLHPSPSIMVCIILLTTRRLHTPQNRDHRGAFEQICWATKRKEGGVPHVPKGFELKGFSMLHSFALLGGSKEQIGPFDIGKRSTSWHAERNTSSSLVSLEYNKHMLLYCTVRILNNYENVVLICPCYAQSGETYQVQS